MDTGSGLVLLLKAKLYALKPKHWVDTVDVALD